MKGKPKMGDASFQRQPTLSGNKPGRNAKRNMSLRFQRGCRYIWPVSTPLTDDLLFSPVPASDKNPNQLEFLT